MTSFNNVKIGERFFHNGWEYIKICCPESGTVGAVELYSGTYYTTDCENSDCGNWLVDVPTLIDVPTKQTKEKKTKQDNEIAIFTCDDDDPIIIRITKEQKRIIEILYDYDILCYDININFKSGTFVVDATKE